MNKESIPFLTVTELSEVIREKEVSPVEVTEAYLERIDALNFKFNSYLTVCRNEALDAARDAERAIAQGNYLGPMHGVPVAVKDQIWTKGIRTTVGGGNEYSIVVVPHALPARELCCPPLGTLFPRRALGCNRIRDGNPLNFEAVPDCKPV